VVAQRPSQWPALFDLAVEIFDRFEAANGFFPEWSFGGGTALMLQIDHRESHDIDIFLNDAQILPYLNPATQGHALSRLPDGYQSDGSGSLKLAYDAVGEIDFICCSNIIDDPYVQQEVRGHVVMLETPAEIVAKKVYFRGGSFQPRDMFDMAAVSARFGLEYVANALRQCGTDRCEIALRTIEKANPSFVRSIIAQLMYREQYGHLVTEAQDISRQLLRLAIA